MCINMIPGTQAQCSITARVSLHQYFSIDIFDLFKRQNFVLNESKNFCYTDGSLR